MGDRVGGDDAADPRGAHGGDLSPDVLPDRRCTGCETANDANTEELALDIATAFERRVGRRPFVVINRLHRRKFGGNRERIEATGGHAPLDAQWVLLHEQIDSAKARGVRVHLRALGTRLALAGYPAVPSAADPAPNEGAPYFSGGYNTERHESRAGGAVDAVQLECNLAGVRDTPANRRAFADALVTALLNS